MMQAVSASCWDISAGTIVDGLACGVGVGPAGGAPPKRTLARVVGDFFAQIARRDAMDLGALFFALIAVPVVPWAAMTIGGVIAFAWVLPTHFKLLELERRKKAASA